MKRLIVALFVLVIVALAAPAYARYLCMGDCEPASVAAPTLAPTATPTVKLAPGAVGPTTWESLPPTVEPPTTEPPPTDVPPLDYPAPPPTATPPGGYPPWPHPNPTETPWPTVVIPTPEPDWTPPPTATPPGG